MNSNTTAISKMVPFGSTEIEGYLLPESLWTKTNKYGLSKTQAILLAYPQHDRSQASVKYIQVTSSKAAQNVAPQGLIVHSKIVVKGRSERVDLLSADQLVTFLKVAKKLGSQSADNLIDDLAGLSVQQIFADAFNKTMTADDRQNFLKEWQEVRELARIAHSAFDNAVKRNKYVGRHVHDLMTMLIFGDTAKMARAKALVHGDLDPRIGLNHQDDIRKMGILYRSKIKFANLRNGTWQDKVNRAVAAIKR